MAFHDKEISTQDGRAAALYLLEWGKTRWRYTSADRMIERDELQDGLMTRVAYMPMAIKDNGMTQGSSQENDFTVDGPGDLPIVRLFRGSPPSETIWLTVRRIQAGETDAPIHWKGTVQNLKRPDPARCQIIGQPLTASLRRTGLRLCWTKECPHYLYDQGCKVKPADYAVQGVVNTITGSTIVLTPAEQKEEGWYRGGYAEWQASDDGTVERRMIELDEVDGAKLAVHLFGLVDFLEIGDTIKVLPGCARIPEVCDTKFDNLPNYGGFDKMPSESPFNNAIW